MSEDAKVFIGSEEVVLSDQSVESGLVKYKTSTEGPMLTATVEQFQSMASPEAYDDGKVTVRKWRPLIENILEMMKDQNVQLADKGWILERIDESITQNHRRALSKLYNVSTVEQISLKQIDDVLTSDEEIPSEPAV